MTIAAKIDLKSLTGIRGFAAWMVVFYHLRDSFHYAMPSMLYGIISKGYLAVDLFFILSGFVMWLNYRGEFQAKGLAAAPSFLVKRIARIYPLHLFMMAGIAGFATLLLLMGKPNLEAYPMAELPFHFLLLQNWGMMDQLAWNDPSWSISAEMAAYIVLPLLAFFFLRTQHCVKKSALWIIILAGVLCGIYYSVGELTLGNYITKLGVVRCILEFSIGVLLAGIFLKIRDEEARSAQTFWLLVGISALGIGAVEGVIPETFAVPLAFAGLILLLALNDSQKWNIFSTKPAIFMGDISYASYLSHYFIWTLFKLALVDDVTHVSLWILALYTVVTIAASTALYYLIEKPGQKFLLKRAMPLITKPA